MQITSIAGFADLIVHSHYSYRDGVCPVEELVRRASELGRPAMALTDSDHAGGFVELQEAAEKYGIKPIFGVDITVAAESESFYRLVFLAQNEEGLQNLFRLLTWAGTNGYDRYGLEKPVLSEAMLDSGVEGLIAIGGSHLSQLLEQNREAEAAKFVSRIKASFGSSFYLGLSPQRLSDKAILSFAQRQNIALVATPEVYYLEPEQARTRDLLWAIDQNTRLDNPQRTRPSLEAAYPFNLDKLQEIYTDVPEALENAALIAASCQVKLKKSGLIVPNFPLPTGFSVRQDSSRSIAGQYLENLAREGLKRNHATISTEMESRLQYELDIIDNAGFSRYILIVADIVQKAVELKILCAPRGSSAGSLVCYAVGITPLNPLAYNLLFERFLNPARLVPPDIDLDIADEDRPRLIDYVVRKYGIQNVAHIITHQFTGAKSALRDAGKVLGSDPVMVNRLVNLVPFEFQKPFTLSRTLESVKEVAQLYKRDAAVKELIDTALLLEGTGRNYGTHAAGVVITPEPVEDYVPLIRTEGLAQKQRENNLGEDNSAEVSGSGFQNLTVMTQWDMEGVEKAGLLKIDLLGLTAWTTITRTLEFIKQEKGVEQDIWKLPVDDEATYNGLCEGHTTGVFQLENRGMTDFTVGMRPRNIQDLAFLIAAYRPGPMPFLGKILAVRNGREQLETPHPLVAPLVAESYGAPVYQETMLRIAREVAGYSLGEADVLRKAIGKKNQAELKAQHQKFVAGAQHMGLTEQEAESIWQYFPPFAFYGFNQAHAIIYGYLTYITAYLKTHFPLEYMAALLGAAGGDLAALSKAASECRRLEVPLLGPDVNFSNTRITIEALEDGRKAVRVGLTAVKGLGPTGVEAIIASRREGGIYKGLADFVRRVPGRSVNSRALTALSRVGALPFGNRAQVEAAIPEAQKAARAKNYTEIILPELPEHSDEKLVSFENELLGFQISGL